MELVYITMSGMVKNLTRIVRETEELKNIKVFQSITEGDIDSGFGIDYGILGGFNYNGISSISISLTGGVRIGVQFADKWEAIGWEKYGEISLMYRTR
jgi:hypothetical protein